METLTSCLGDANCVASTFIGGLTSAAILFLVASGLSLVFGVLRVLNFAHGALYMLGAYLGFAVVSATGNTGFWLAVVIAPLLVAAVGGVLEVAFLRRIYERELLYQLLLTYAFVLIFDDLVAIIWGSTFQSVQVPRLLAGFIDLRGVRVPIYQSALVVIALGIAGSLWLLLTRTRLGITIRASAADAEMAGALGVNVPAIWTLVFMLGAFLGGLGGILAAPLRSIFPGMGLDIIVQSFIVVVVGGLGSLPGAALGALFIGLMRAWGVLIFPELELAFVYLLMALVLIVRPMGLMGRPLGR